MLQCSGHVVQGFRRGCIMNLILILLKLVFNYINMCYLKYIANIIVSVLKVLANHTSLGTLTRMPPRPHRYQNQSHMVFLRGFLEEWTFIPQSPHLVSHTLKAEWNELQVALMDLSLCRRSSYRQCLHFVGHSHARLPLFCACIHSFLHKHRGLSAQEKHPWLKKQPFPSRSSLQTDGTERHTDRLL